MTDFKLDYVSRLFQKTGSKRIENYVITRLWHKIDCDDIQIIPQQYVGLPEARYALTDVFLPQVNLFVEINEPAHYISAEKIELDEARARKIKGKTGFHLFTVDCRDSLAQIHLKIDEIVQFIHKEADRKRSLGTFKPWRPNETRNPDYWIAKRSLSESDEIIMTTIEDICKLFAADFRKTKRGFLRKGAIDHPNQHGLVIWWPSKISRSGWKNEIMENGDIITESHDLAIKTREHYFNTIKHAQQRIIFYFEKDILGFTGYFFKGVYKIDENLSNEQDGIYWRRVSRDFLL